MLVLAPNFCLLLLTRPTTVCHMLICIVGGLTALFALVVYDFIYPKILKSVQNVELRRYALAPGIDFFNHSDKVVGLADVSYEYFADRFVVRSGEQYNSGDQVYISYGPQSNDSLLQFYGFVEDDNANDNYTFGPEADEVFGLPKGALRTRKDGFSPSVMKRVTNSFKGDTKRARAELATLCDEELKRFPTTLEHDVQMLNDEEGVTMSAHLRLALRYRIAKKTVLSSAARALREL